MKDYIIFRVAQSFYALEVASVERIIHLLPVTPVPYAHPYVEGMVSYEKKVTKVVNFRKMTGLRSYEEELGELFAGAAAGYAEWTASLERVLRGGDILGFTTDLRLAAFGEWLEGFNSHDAEILGLLKKLRPLHARLLEKGKELLWAQQSDPQRASELFGECSAVLLPQIVEVLGEMATRNEAMAEQLQKMIMVRSNGEFFAIKIDSIDDMAQIDEETIRHVDEMGRKEPFLETEGVVDIGGNLVNVIKTVLLPVREAA